MNNRRRKRKNRQWLFALLFAVSFFAAMPFVVRALGGQESAPAVEAAPPSDTQAESPADSAHVESGDDGSASQIADSSDTPGVPEEAPENASDDAGGISDNDMQDQDIPADSAPDQPSYPQGPSSSGNAASDGFTTVEDSYFDDALFIGDSRTVGLSEYGDLQNADFFATTGMSVYNVLTETVSVPSVGKVTLDELLGGMTYGKVYLMLGINELGYDFNSTVEKYGQVVDYIREKQPDAIIYIEANLHVTKSRSDSDKIFNNRNIEIFISDISSLEKGHDILYIDVI